MCFEQRLTSRALPASPTSHQSTWTTTSHTARLPPTPLPHTVSTELPELNSMSSRNPQTFSPSALSSLPTLQYSSNYAARDIFYPHSTSPSMTQQHWHIHSFL